MKKISEHLGELIVSLACIALLISVTAFYRAPVSDFFAGITSKLTSVGSTVLDAFENGPSDGGADDEAHGDNIWFYQPYKGTLGGTPTELVFHADGSYDVYVFDENYGFSMDPGTCTYEEGKVTMDIGEAEISDLGYTLYIPDQDFTLKLEKVQKRYMSFDKLYKTQYETSSYNMIFYKDGSSYEYSLDNGASLEDAYNIWECPAGTYKYFDEAFTESFEDETYLCAIHPTGRYVIYADNIYELACSHLNTEVRNATDEYTGDKYCKDCGALLEKGKHVIPAGGKYTSKDGTVYEEGDEFPETVQNGDKYTYGDYEYRYNTSKFTMYGGDSWSGMFDNSQNGWGVDTIRNTESSYGPILESINGKPITSLVCTFRNCTFMSVAPQIPNTVTNLEGAFAYSGIVTAPKIPTGVINMCSTFERCTNLTQGTTIPSSVTNIKAMFRQCTQLTGSIMINATPTDWQNKNNNYVDCFKDTSLPIEISGASPALQKIASTSSNGNVTSK